MPVAKGVIIFSSISVGNIFSKPDAARKDDISRLEELGWMFSSFFLYRRLESNTFLPSPSSRVT